MAVVQTPTAAAMIPATTLAATSKLKNIITNVTKTQICKNNIHIYKRLPTKLQKYIDLTKNFKNT
jgi:hypothetical protein